jgi:hypothetical protein
LQTSETVLEKTRSPKDDGVASAAKLVSNLQIGRLILGSQPQDQPTAKDQGLRRRVGSGESLQAILCFEVQDNRRRKGVWHDGHPFHETGAICQLDVNAPSCLGQLQLCSDLRNGHLVALMMQVPFVMDEKVQFSVKEKELIAPRTSRAGIFVRREEANLAQQSDYPPATKGRWMRDRVQLWSWQSLSRLATAGMGVPSR